MTTPYIGQILQFAGNFPPQGFVRCDGSLLQISQYDALFTLIGTTYGGDGQNTFGVPNLVGRVPIHQGTLGGGATYPIGAQAGETSVTIINSTMPSHNHAVTVCSGGSVGTPGTSVFIADENPAPPTPKAYSSSTAGLISMAQGSIGFAGGNQPHANVQPVLAITICIAVVGVYPPRN